MLARDWGRNGEESETHILETVFLERMNEGCGASGFGHRSRSGGLVEQHNIVRWKVAILEKLDELLAKESGGAHDRDLLGRALCLRGRHSLGVKVSVSQFRWKGVAVKSVYQSWP